MPPETSRHTAGRSLWLRGDGRGGFSPVPGQHSGLQVYGEQRGAALADFDADSRLDLVVTQNAAETKLYRNVGARPGLRVRLVGPPGNLAGIGAVVRLGAGGQWGPARELHGGSGYWSQDSAVLVLGLPERDAGVSPAGGGREPAEGRLARELWVRWPGGKVTTAAVPAGAREVAVDVTGKIRVIR